MVMDPELFTRAKCKTTRAVAALPKQALKDGHFPEWEAVDGPLPEGPKPAVVFPKLVDEPTPEPEPATDSTPDPKSADTKSANKKE